MPRNTCGLSPRLLAFTVSKLALIFVLLTVNPCAPATPNKSNNDLENAQIYSRAFDLVFQASQETIRQWGLHVTDQDKPKGEISAWGTYRLQCDRPDCDTVTVTFDLRFQTVGPGPETRVIIDTRRRPDSGSGAWEKGFNKEFLGELQKVLNAHP